MREFMKQQTVAVSYVEYAARELPVHDSPTNDDR
jgi:hypothetical protein